jgi:ABC-type transport system involved in multi-copper enzyme maturation permease subunit
MIRLVKVELTRLRWRRAVLLLLLACFVAPLLIWAGTAWETRPLSEADIARAEQQVATDAAHPSVARELKRCERRPERYGGPGTTPDMCEDMLLPSVENYLFRSPLDVSQMPEGQGVAVAVILSALLLLLGTTFAGHDWNTGSMSNQLLFEPRRLRVWLAKAAAVLVTGLVVTTAALLPFWGATALLAVQRGIDVPGATWETVITHSLRAVALAALCGLLGYALTMLFRSTVATLGVGFAAAMGASLLLVGVFGEQAQAWLPSTNYLAVLVDGYEYYVYTPACESQMGGGMPGASGEVVDPCMAQVSMGHGVGYLTVLLVLVIALSAVAFRRRDVP